MHTSLFKLTPPSSVKGRATQLGGGTPLVPCTQGTRLHEAPEQGQPNNGDTAHTWLLLTPALPRPLSGLATHNRHPKRTARSPLPNHWQAWPGGRKKKGAAGYAHRVLTPTTVLLSAVLLTTVLPHTTLVYYSTTHPHYCAAHYCAAQYSPARSSGARAAPQWR